MTINVYWTCIEEEWMRAKEPELVSSLFYKSDLFDKNDPGLDMKNCPSFNTHLKNVYAMRSLYSYDFFVNGQDVFSNDYDQKFFDKHVTLKSLNKKLFSFRQSYVFFTEEDSLNVTLSQTPYLEDNEISKNLIVLPGILDIGKWYRNTDTMFYMKNEINNFTIKENDVYAYITFHTEEKINFIQYRNNEKLNGYLLDSINSKNNKKSIYSLNKYYSFLKNKKTILKEIKENILEN